MLAITGKALLGGLHVLGLGLVVWAVWAMAVAIGADKRDGFDYRLEEVAD